MHNVNDGKFTRLGLTYDDVLLVPAYSNVLPREVDVSVQLTKKLKLNAPILSAAMDTVTEYRLAIALAREGGIGILHKNMPAADQAEQVRLVKRSESGMIVDPVTLKKDATVRDARALMNRHKIGGIPIVDDKGVLLGIVTNRDLRFETRMDRALVEIMTHEKLVTARQGTTLDEAESLLQDYKVEKLPIVDDKRRLVGLITFKDIEKKKNFPNACKDSIGRLRVGAAVGVTPDTLDRVRLLVDAGVDLVTVDTAHGHSEGVLRMVRAIRSEYPALDIMAGNIATAAAAEALAKAGADIVKVGVGPGEFHSSRLSWKLLSSRADLELVWLQTVALSRRATSQRQSQLGQTPSCSVPCLLVWMRLLAKLSSTTHESSSRTAAWAVSVPWQKAARIAISRTWKTTSTSSFPKELKDESHTKATSVKSCFRWSADYALPWATAVPRMSTS